MSTEGMFFVWVRRAHGWLGDCKPLPEIWYGNAAQINDRRGISERSGAKVFAMHELKIGQQAYDIDTLVKLYPPPNLPVRVVSRVVLSTALQQA